MEAKAEKRNIGDWIRFLEAQIANRNSELSILRSELEEKLRVNQDLMKTLESDSHHLSEMTNALDSAGNVVKQLEEKVTDLERSVTAQHIQLEELRHSEASLLQERNNLEAEVHKLREEIASRRTPYGKYVFIGIVGMLLGALPFALRSISETTQLIVEKGPPEAAATKSVTASPMIAKQELKAQPLPPTNVATPTLSLPGVQETPPSSESWTKALADLRESAFGVESSVPFDLSPVYSENASPTVITRSQFRDIISKTLATSLPSRTSDGLLLYALDSDEVDENEFAEMTRNENLPVAPLCNPWHKDPAFFRRLSILVTNSSANLGCLNELVTSQWFKNHWEEIAIVSLKTKARNSATYFAEKKFLTFQEWDLNWIVKATAPVEGEKTSLPELRATRLARLARILTKSSDVRVQIPIRSTNKNANMNFGNLSIIPAEISSGQIRVSRLSLQTGQPSGRVVMQPIAPGARAVIINGAEQSLSVETTNAR